MFNIEFVNLHDHNILYLPFCLFIYSLTSCVLDTNFFFFKQSIFCLILWLDLAFKNWHTIFGKEHSIHVHNFLGVKLFILMCTKYCCYIMYPVVQYNFCLWWLFHPSSASSYPCLSCAFSCLFTSYHKIDWLW